MYAAANLADALSATRRYVGAIGYIGWLKLALVVLFIGGLGVFDTSFNVVSELTTSTDVVTDDIRSVLLIAGLVLAVYLAFGYLAAVLEFIFVESLRSESIHVRRYARANLWRALWLLLFRIGLLLATGALIAALVAAAVVLGDVPEPDALSAEQFLQIVALAIPPLLGWTVVNHLTTAFVVPIMLLEDRGPISSWARFARTISTNWAGYLAFVAVAWTVGILLWVLFAIIGFFAMFVGILLFIVVTAAFESADPSLATVAVVLFIVAYLCYQYVLALAEAPVRAYVRYYALLILGDTDAELDLIPDQRAAIRSDGDSSSRTEGGRDERQRHDIASRDDTAVNRTVFDDQRNRSERESSNDDERGDRFE